MIILTTPQNTHNPLADLSEAGVSLWLDDLSRQRLQSGNLKNLITDSHIVGVTTNPSIFQAALKDGASYQKQIGELKAGGQELLAGVARPWSPLPSVCRLVRCSARWSGL